jgi:hypothetical protein
VWRYDDAGILGYAPIDLLMEKTLAEDPSAFDPVGVLHQAAASNDVDASEVTKAMKQLEKAKEKQVSGGCIVCEGRISAGKSRGVSVM